jgi:hypothetical protein
VAGHCWPLDDHDVDVRIIVIEALRQLGDQQAVAPPLTVGINSTLRSAWLSSKG